VPRKAQANNELIRRISSHYSETSCRDQQYEHGSTGNNRRERGRGTLAPGSFPEHITAAYIFQCFPCIQWLSGKHIRGKVSLESYSSSPLGGVSGGLLFVISKALSSRTIRPSTHSMARSEQ
jgi:hypothetical protein